VPRGLCCLPPPLVGETHSVQQKYNTSLSIRRNTCSVVTKLLDMSVTMASSGLLKVMQSRVWR